MNILILSSDYPNKYRTSFAFVKQLVDAIADRGNHCYVIAPHSITYEKRIWFGTEYNKRANGGTVTIYRPNFLSFSTMQIGKFRPSSFFKNKAVKRALSKISIVPDVAYGHFWSNGWMLYEYSKKNSIPLFVATGESIISQAFKNTPEKKPFYDYVSGVICVSSKNRDESISLGLTTEDKCIVAPNSINNSLFKVLDKAECRTRLNLPHDVFIVAFVGWFKEVKGPKRVAKALDGINIGEKVYSIFVGAGEHTEDNPECKNILFRGRLKQEQVPMYLNAADVFVLPTLHEGCCNSIVEAMACGLPIISSNLPFNWDILDNTNSIMIDPNNSDEIREAIIKLRDDKILRNELSNGSINKSKNLTLDKRAERIEGFIMERLLDNKKNRYE